MHVRTAAPNPTGRLHLRSESTSCAIPCMCCFAAPSPTGRFRTPLARCGKSNQLDVTQHPTLFKLMRAQPVFGHAQKLMQTRTHTYAHTHAHMHNTYMRIHTIVNHCLYTGRGHSSDISSPPAPCLWIPILILASQCQQPNTFSPC
jgi:hypothetical protein